MILERTIRIASLAIPIFFCAGPETTRAENPAGGYEIELGGSNPIITIGDISVEEQQCEDVPGVGLLCVEISTNIPVNVDARGKISGIGTFTFADGGGDIEIVGIMSCMVSGRVNGRMDSASRDHDTKITIRARCKGDVIVTGAAQGVFPTKITARFKGESDDDGFYVGEASTRVSIRGLGSERVVAPVFLELGNGGDWTISLNIVDIDGKKLGGTASATLDDGSRLTFEIRARYNEKKDESNVTLKPHTAFRGASIRLRHLVVTGGAITGGELKYRVNGQKGKVLDP
jgi:hypothetical protein